ncbi:MAG: SgcJ/EcaC family oxidoreductase [Pirellulales bacterium]
MMRTIPTSIAILLLFVVPIGASAQESTAPSDAEHGIQQMFSQYIDAFNDGDAAAVSSLWDTEAVWSSSETGERSVGREAITSDFAKFFAESPGARLTGSVDRVQLITPEVAVIDGTVVVNHPETGPSESVFTATLVNRDGRWLLSNVSESQPPVPETPYQRLKELEFLVGQWDDDTEDAAVHTSVRWGAGRSFLIRSYTIDRGDPEVAQGTQVIGWDPLQNRFVSWNFESDGTFGLGNWARDGGIGSCGCNRRSQTGPVGRRPRSSRALTTTR